jgi:hypothetical protein
VAAALARAAVVLARAAVAFHAVKLAGLAVNLVTFPVLRPPAAGPGRIWTGAKAGHVAAGPSA